ncbi:MAG TPA: hypothetical protein VN716_18865 [Vicinamibacterales bacterium]|nr:hypothetical protein [Vicinamibacterales bacterium]
MRINVTRPGGFKYAFHGVDVHEYLPGIVEVPQEVADLAVAEKWAETVIVPPAADSPPSTAPAVVEKPAPRGARGRSGR